MRHFRVVHRLSRHLRLISPVLEKEAERCYLMEILLHKQGAITGVKSVPEIGSLTLYYRPEVLPEFRLLALLEALLGKLAAAPPRPVAAPAPAGTEPLSEHWVAIEGMSCASCALLIELAFQRDPRVESVRVNYASGTANLRARLDREALFAAIARLGYTPRPMDTLAQRRLLLERERQQLAAARRQFIQSALFAAPVLLTGMAMHQDPLLRLMEFTLSSAALFGSGGDIFKKAWTLARQRQANMDSLIALGAGAAWLYSLPGLIRPAHPVYFESAAGIIGFVLLGRYLEVQARGKASEAIRKLIELQPETACRIDAAGEESQVPLDAVREGDLLRVRPGERVAADGVLLQGRSTVDEALLTGESLPVPKMPGDKVVGGTINGTGSFVLQVGATGPRTVLAGIIRMVEAAQDMKLPVQKLADRISARFVPAVATVAGLTSIAWLAAGAPAATALAHGVAVLLIACPCALGLATPTAIMVGTGEAARRGIYIRRGEALESTARLTTLVFDKTGTLTEGRPQVTDLVWAEGLDAAARQALLAAVAGAEGHSEHFLAQAIAAWCREQGIAPAPVQDFTALPGAGLTCRHQGQILRLGNAALMAGAGVEVSPLAEPAAAFARQGKTPVLVALEGRCLALFAIADRPRPQAREALARLHRLGLETVMATGDLEAVARHVAGQVGIGPVLARASPAEKLALVRRLQAGGRRVGMIGDGINDAPALAAADVGFAVGGATDIAQEAADIVLVGGDIARVAAGIELSRRTLRIIRQNLFWALGYNTVAIPIAAAGRLTPMIASAAMALSSVSVLGNSLRLKR